MRALIEVLRSSAVLALGGLIASTSCVADPSTDAASSRVVAPVAAAPPDDGQWTMPAKNFASTRYSELAEINTENVAKLQVAFTFSMGVNKGQEAPPLVANETMYLVSPYPNILYALDLAKPGAPLKWQYAPKPEAAAQGVACCDVVNRGPVFSGGRLFYNTLDGITVAVDAQTGKEVWRTKLGNIHVGETITMAPLVVKNKVLVGNSGGEMGVRGWIAALDVDSGKLVWKAYNTGPDSEVLIGSDFKPFYAKDRGKDLGVSTWPPDAWRIGGGNVWGWISYDPDLNLIYYGSGNPGPWNPDLRPGDNKWTTTIFARDPDTGAARWAYQMNPHDLFDHDGVNENILLDVPWKGATRKVLLHPDRNGILYMLDRATGEVLSAEHYGYVNSNKGVNLKTGELIRNDEYTTGTDKTCPRCLSDRIGRQRLESIGVLAANRLSLHSSQQSLHGSPREPGELHRRHAVCRGRGEDEGWAWRQSRRV